MHKIKGPRDRARREPGRGRERDNSVNYNDGVRKGRLIGGSALGSMFRLKSHQATDADRRRICNWSSSEE